MARGADAGLLDQWRSATLTYTPGQRLDPSWKHDRYDVTLTAAGTNHLLDRAADLLWRYDFYPPSVMLHTCDFELDERPMRPGDRLIQRVRVLPYALDLITMTEIVDILDEPRRKGFTYMTTTRHDELGEWTACVEWRDDESLVLVVAATSRTGDHIPGVLRPYGRYLQKRAHRLGIARFKRLLLG